MQWNMAPEAISIVVLSIIWAYAYKGNPTPSLKNRLFQISLMVTFLSMSTNLLSTWLIYTLSPQTYVLTWLVNLVYFIVTPLMGMVYFFYVQANIYEDSPKLPRYLLWAALPGVAYAILILINPFTGWIFRLTVEGGYSQGPLIQATYIIFYVYCLACILLALVKGRKLARFIRSVLFVFPLGAGIVIVIQMFMPQVVLSGSAATCSLLLIYLFLQNKQLCIDHLTKLPNRQEFLKMLELHMRHHDQFTLCVISLREFKRVNDIHGQHNGDAILSAVSQYLRGKQLSLREGELYRYSGDEFVLLLPKGDLQRLKQLQTQILNRFAQPWEVEACSCILYAAIGVVNCPDTSDKLEELINGLEYAVSLAKKDTGKNVCYCTPDLLEQARRRQTIADLLRYCVQNDGFEVYYQPVYSIEQNRFVMAEALLRLNDTPLGNISPAEFIPIAEESGLIIDITYLVLEKVCKYLRGLFDQGVEFEGVSVNFSPLQFTQQDVIERMTAILGQYDIPFSKIKVEVIESAFIDNNKEVFDYIKRLHELGIHIGLDDFGTGYSNFAAVVKLPFDTIKLDKSLIWSSMTNTRFAIIVQNLASALRDMGIYVLAEGVENEEQCKFVVESGCHYIQGFYYARPMNGEAFLEVMKNPVPKIEGN